MKQVCKKTALLCATLMLIGTGQTWAEDAHNDGAAAIHGQVLLDKWRRDPATPGKLALVTPGKVYAAKRLKLEPGAYFVSEMARIAAAGSDKSARTVTMMQLQGQRPMDPSHTSPGERSLAASMGVDAKDYSLSELARMKFAEDF